MASVVDGQGRYVRAGDKITHPGIHDPFFFVAVAGRNLVWVTTDPESPAALVACYAHRFGLEVVR